MHPVSAPPSPVDERFIVLRDGTVATVRPVNAGDHDAIRRFFEDLSPDSRRLRFHAAGAAADSTITQLCGARDPERGLTLIALRAVKSAIVPIAVASYFRLTTDSAEAAFAVADPFQGKGIGTALLERLAAIAAAHGIRVFRATTMTENARMLEVFRDSGFEIRSKSGSGCVDVQLTLGRGDAPAEEVRHRLATAASLRSLFQPKAVAVVGASRDTSSIGRRVLDAIVSGGFTGAIYPVNPRAAEIGGLKAYASARDLPAGVDLALVTVPAEGVLPVVDDCAAARIRSLVVVTAGFSEAGTGGRELQAALTEKVRNYGMRMVGPNCMGVINASPEIRLNASFSPLMPQPGRIGLMSQSGALGLAIISLASDRGLGFSTFVSAGNKADVSGNDLLEYWEDDPATDVILLYLESFGNPRRFARTARRVGRTKPIVAVKSGRTLAGTRAAGSHTAALANRDVAVDALFHQAGVIRAETIDEMFDLATLLANQPLPTGRRTAIVTNAGGPGILAADACEGAGLQVVDLSEETHARLAAFLPAMATGSNPVDMIASAGPETFRQTVETMLAAPETDALLVIFTSVEAGSTGAVLEGIAKGVVDGRAHAPHKPVLVCLLARHGPPTPITAGSEHLATYAFPENAVRALGKAAAYAEWRAKPPALFWGFDDMHVEEARTVCRRALDARRDTWLTSDEVQQILSAFGIPVVAGSIARSTDEAAALAAAIGFPVVAKLSSSGIQHKTEVGAVRLGITDAEAVRQAFKDISAIGRRAASSSASDGVLIQAMLEGGVETMIGLTQDPVFGPLIAFGLGGIHVEILGDVRFRIAPLTDRDADELLHEVKGFRLLAGYRGHPAADLDGLRELLLRLSRLAEELPEVAELDLNPVIALPPGHGCRVVDARMRVKRP